MESFTDDCNGVFEGLLFLHRLRPMQAGAMDVFRRKYERWTGDERLTFHVVAPPGAGKTILGLALASRLGAGTVVFSPTSTIQRQWVDEASRSFEILDRVEWYGRTLASTDPRDEPVILSLTYQSVSTRGEDGELHPNAGALLELVREGGRRTVVLDECHHLTMRWGGIIEGLLRDLKNPVVLGFTATPPVEASGCRRRRYVELLGEVDYSIPLPAVVKEGFLAPYQDLVYFTEVDEGVRDLLRRDERRLRDLLDVLERGDGSECLSLWIEKLLRRKGAALAEKDVDLCVACGRYLRDRGIDVPLEVPWMDEMEGTLEVRDMAAVLQAYLDAGEGGAEADSIHAAMEAVGYRWRNGRFVPVETGSTRHVTLAPSKLEAMLDILRLEAAYMGDSLRALVLVDYERRSSAAGGINAFDVMDALTRDKETDSLDPVTVTGRSLLVDDDVCGLFMERLEAFASEHGYRFEAHAEAVPGEPYVYVRGRGPDWSTAVYTAFVTRLLEHGLVRVIVGTRALLGEGWDSVKLNTLVDLTVVAGFVSVNQIRGRSIRLDPDDPLKCSNNWDVVALAPGASAGLADFRRLERKHSQFYGVCEDGVVEKGIAHVHPYLAGVDVSSLCLEYERINADMKGRAVDRLAALRRWRVGEPFSNAERQAVEIGPPVSGKNARASGGSSFRRAAEDGWWSLPRAYLLEDLQAEAAAVSRSCVDVLSSMCPSLLRRPVRAVLSGLFRLSSPVLNRILVGMMLAARRGESPAKSLEPYLACLLEALCSCELLERKYALDDVAVLARDGGFVRVYLRNAPDADASLFSSALWEMMGPYQGQKYVIERRAPSLGPLTRLLLPLPAAWTRGRNGGVLVGVHPVPSVLCRRKSMAEEFRKAWNAHVAPGAIWYTRHGRGREVAERWLRRRPFPVRRRTKQIWI